MTAGHAVRWTCPECQVRVTGMAQRQDDAETALLAAVRDHAQLHAGPVNAVAAASWLAEAGHLVELYGGALDGDRLWLPPGDLPDVIGVHRTADGAAVPIRSATLRMLPHVEAYRWCPDRLRYVHDGRPL